MLQKRLICFAPVISRSKPVCGWILRAYFDRDMGGRRSAHQRAFVEWVISSSDQPEQNRFREGRTNDVFGLADRLGLTDFFL